MTVRDTPPDLDVDLDLLLADLARHPVVRRVSLGGLGLDDVRVLAGGRSADAAAIVAATGGNPLLVQHMVADDGGTLAALLWRRNAMLDGEASAILDLAATFGSEFDAGLLATASGASLMAVLEALELAESAGLVVPLPGRHGQFRFVHALFRSHRYEALSWRRQLGAHAAVATALATRPGDDRLLPELARHACLSAPVGDAHAAIDLACHAGRAAERSYAFAEAATHYRRGLRVAQALDPPDAHLSLDMTIRLAAVLHHLGDPEGLPMLLDAAARARAFGDHAALVRAGISFSHFGSAGAFGRPAHAQLAVVEHALSVVGTEPSAERARLLIELAVQIAGVRVDESVELAMEAEAIARRLGDDEVLGTVLLGARHVGRHPGRMAEYERIGLELERLGSRLRSLPLSLAGVSVQTLSHLERGELRNWIAGQDQLVQMLGDRPLTSFELQVQVHRASREAMDGRFEAAEELARTTGRLAHTLGYSRDAYTGPIILLCRRLQGRDPEMLDALERIVHAAGDVWVYRCALAAVRARSGKLTAARRSLDALRHDRHSMPHGNTWAVAMAELAEAAEVAGDTDTAAHVHTELAPYAGNIAATATGVNRPIDQALAQAALAMGDNASAEHHAQRAVSASRHRNTPVFLARELVFLAEARRRAGTSRHELRVLVDEARAIADMVGATVVRADIERYEDAGP